MNILKNDSWQNRRKAVAAPDFFHRGGQWSHHGGGGAETVLPARVGVDQP